MRWSWRAFRVGAAGAVDSDAFNSSPARSPTLRTFPAHIHIPASLRTLARSLHLAVHYLAGGDLLAQLHGISRVWPRPSMDAPVVRLMLVSCMQTNWPSLVVRTEISTARAPLLTDSA